MSPSILKIRLWGDPILRKKAYEVAKVEDDEKQLILEMLETMYHYKGIGLAAPQVGVDSKIFVMDIGEGPIIVVNPQIIRKVGSEVLEEGCLSIPGVNIKVSRPTKVRVRYMDANNRMVEREFEDLLARVFQHENDHLNGRMIVDYASIKEKLKIKPVLKEINKIRQQKDV